MKNMKKLKILAGALIVLLITIIIVNSNLKSEKDYDNYTNQTSDVKSPDSTKMVRDYLEPTPEEKAELYSLYGYDNVEFTSQGIVIKPGDYNSFEKKLCTDVWPDTELTSKVKKPVVGKVNTVEVGETYIIIELKNITEKEAKEYISEIKSEYTKSEKSKENGVLFLARNSEDVLVKVSYNGTICTINYSGF